MTKTALKAIVGYLKEHPLIPAAFILGSIVTSVAYELF